MHIWYICYIILQFLLAKNSFCNTIIGIYVFYKHQLCIKKWCKIHFPIIRYMNLHHFTTLNLFFYEMTKFLLKLRSFTIYIIIRYWHFNLLLQKTGLSYHFNLILRLFLWFWVISCGVMLETNLSPTCQPSPLQ